MPSRVADLRSKLALVQPRNSAINQNGSHPELVSDIPTSSTDLPNEFARYKRLLAEDFVIDDWQGITIVMAAVVAHYVPGEMLWMRILGASRGGKTEMVRAFRGHVDTEMLGSMTPASIRGGFRSGDRLLDRLNGRLVITEDLSPIITMRNEPRKELFGLLRSVKDGQIVSDFNVPQGHQVVKSSFDWIACVTPESVEKERTLEAVLGQRFIDVRYELKDSSAEDRAIQAQENNPRMFEIRQRLSESAYAILDSAAVEADKAPIDLLDKRWIGRLAWAVARSRTPVSRDYRTKQLTMHPLAESPTSLAQDLNRLAHGLLLLGFTEYQPYLQRVGWDCLPSVRAKIMRVLRRGIVQPAGIARKTGYAESQVAYELEAMRLLRIIDHKANFKPDMDALLYSDKQPEVKSE